MLNIAPLEGMRKPTCLDSLSEATTDFKGQRVTFTVSEWIDFSGVSEDGKKSNFTIYVIYFWFLKNTDRLIFYFYFFTFWTGCKDWEQQKAFFFIVYDQKYQFENGGWNVKDKNTPKYNTVIQNMFEHQLWACQNFRCLDSAVYTKMPLILWLISLPTWRQREVGRILEW